VPPDTSRTWHRARRSPPAAALFPDAGWPRGSHWRPPNEWPTKSAFAILRCSSIAAISSPTIRKSEQVQLDIRFRGGASKTLMLPKPLRFCERHRQNPAMVAEMDRLLDDYNYADTARILNEKRFKTGDGLPVTPLAVGYIRKGIWIEEPIRSAPRTRPADHFGNGKSLRRFHKHNRTLAPKGHNPSAHYQ
jgi:hypothetical protein